MEIYKIFSLGFISILTLIAATRSQIRDAPNDKEANSLDSNTDSLRLVILVLRHGDRAPQDTYPNDPYKNDPMEPYGWGQLTNKGRLEQYNQGAYLRKRYNHFLGNKYSPDIFWLQSTASDRTKMSALLEAAALWQPNEKQTFKTDLHWQPVTLNYQDNNDTLLLIWSSCPDYSRMRKSIQYSREVKKIERRNINLFKNLSKYTGMEIANADDVFSLYGTLEAEANMELNLPEWTKEFFPQKMLELSELSLEIDSYNETLKKMRAAPLITKIADAVKAKSEGKLKPEERKMFMFVGHDSTIVSLLSGLNIWNRKIPGYSNMVMMELHEDHSRWNVQIFHKNSTTQQPYPLTIPECSFACPLEKFLVLASPMILTQEEWIEECRLKDLNYVSGKIPLP